MLDVVSVAVGIFVVWLVAYILLHFHGDRDGVWVTLLSSLFLLGAWGVVTVSVVAIAWLVSMVAW